jgi:hypothetical protein
MDEDNVQCEAEAPPQEVVQRETSKEHEVRIKQVENGFYVKVSCKGFVFDNISDLLEAIDLFYTDFKAAKKKYLTE